MREILFRGKEKDQWVSGYYWKYEQNGKEFHVIRDSADKLLKFNHICAPETIGQFTGALDCYEKKIYEGDILRYTTDYDGLDGFTRTIDTRAVVVWDPDVLGFACKEIGDDSGDLYSWLEMRENPDIEIIGNIHDNPELIEDMDIKPAAKRSDSPAEQLGLAPAT